MSIYLGHISTNRIIIEKHVIKALLELLKELLLQFTGTVRVKF